FEIARVKGQDPGIGIRVALDDVLHDSNEARMASKHEPGAGGLNRLGDVPGKANVVANAGDEGDPPTQVNGYHARPRFISGQSNCLRANAFGLVKACGLGKAMAYPVSPARLPCPCKGRGIGTQTPLSRPTRSRK